MAQRTEKEETEFKAVPETITPCVNNCGVTGNHHATNNMCQNCFTATSSAAVAAAQKIGRSASRSPRRPSSSLEARIPVVLARADTPDRSDAASAKREVNRCSGCRRKVGLTGFRCRCGDLFCSEHRYSDRHDCSYDYKTAGREAIAMENPVVKAAKIVRI